MGMRRRRRQQQDELFITADQLPKSEGHAFYAKLNKLLDEAGFDEFDESECQACYDASGNGRPSIPPGVYFRMLVVGYYEARVAGTGQSARHRLAL
jgi:transposase